MSDSKEKQCLTGIIKALENPEANDRKMNFIVSIVLFLGIGSYVAAFFGAKFGALESNHSVSIGFAGGVLLGIAVYMSINRKFTPFVLRHIDKQSVESRLREL